MEWTRSETLALASNNCAQCHGMGLRPGRRKETAPCNCVFRAIFRACYERFVHCATDGRVMSNAKIELNAGTNRRCTYGRRDEEYVADFCLLSRRVLTDAEHRVFRYHFLLGADWRLCCRKLKMDRGTFFHIVYRVQQRLGRVFREIQPYGLFPLDEYFNGTMRNPLPTLPELGGKLVLLRPVSRLSDKVPLKKAA
jgi:hypothetical protein